MRARTCKTNQRRRQLKASHRKVSSRYRVYFRVTLLNTEEVSNSNFEK
ncbi:hypothetical protein [Thalassotalea sp. ND16A]|nr:hypothetical protein [Thalassotalea sp. ND16A]KGK00650.1 hypothetical protein ND16A_3410 [Thalassotalea sp. ND16A]